ncbi:I78 family peptidase inhibitor [Sphingomonas sp. RS6]
MSRVIAILLAAPVALAGCAPKTAQPLPPGIQCNANPVLALKGKPRSAATEAEALQRSGAKRVRWIEPGSAVTMDFRPDRLNLSLDETGTITDARCG